LVPKALRGAMGGGGAQDISTVTGISARQSNALVWRKSEENSEMIRGK